MNEIHKDCLPEVSTYQCHDSWIRTINEIDFAGAFLLGFALIVILQNINYRFKSEKAPETNLPDIVSGFTAISLIIQIIKLIMVQPPFSEKLPFYFTYIIIVMPITQAAYAAVGHTWNNISKSKRSEQIAVRAQARTMGIIVFMLSISSLSVCRWTLMRAVNRNDMESVNTARYATVATYAFLNLITFGYLFSARNTMARDLKRIGHSFVKRQLTRMLNLGLLAAIFAILETASLVIREFFPNLFVVQSVCLMISYVCLTFFCSQWQIMFAASHSKGIERFSPFTVVIGANSNGAVDDEASVVEWNDESVPELQENRRRKIKKHQEILKAKEQEELDDLIDPEEEPVKAAVSSLESIRNVIHTKVSHTFRFSAGNLNEDEPDISDIPNVIGGNSDPFETSESKEDSDIKNQICFSKKNSQVIDALVLDDPSERMSVNRPMEGFVVVAGGRTSDAVPERRRSLHAGQEHQLQRARESMEEDERQRMSKLTKEDWRPNFFNVMTPRTKSKYNFNFDRTESNPTAASAAIAQSLRPSSARASSKRFDFKQRPGSARLTPTSAAARARKRPTSPDNGFHSTKATKSSFDSFNQSPQAGRSATSATASTTALMLANSPRSKRGMEALLGGSSSPANRPPSSKAATRPEGRSPSTQTRSPRGTQASSPQATTGSPSVPATGSPRGIGKLFNASIAAAKDHDVENQVVVGGNPFARDNPTARLTTSSMAASVDRDGSQNLSDIASQSNSQVSVSNRFTSPAADFGDFEYTDQEVAGNSRKSEGQNKPSHISTERKIPIHYRPSRPTRRKSGVQTLKDMFQPKNMDFGGLWLDHIDKAIEDEVFHLQEYIRLSKNMARFWKNEFSFAEFVSYPNPVNVAEIRILAAVNFVMIVICINLDVRFNIYYPYLFIAFTFLTRPLFGPRIDPISHLVLFSLMPLFVNRLEILDDDFSAGPPVRFSQAISSSLVIGAVVVRFVLYYVSGVEASGVIICAIIMSIVAMNSLVETAAGDSPAVGVFMWLLERGYLSDDIGRACSIQYKSARHRLNLGVMGKYQQKQLKRMDTIARALDIVNTAASVLSPRNIIPRPTTPSVSARSPVKESSPPRLVRPESKNETTSSQEKKTRVTVNVADVVPVAKKAQEVRSLELTAEPSKSQRVIKASLSSRRLSANSGATDEYEVIRSTSVPKISSTRIENDNDL